MPSVEYKVIRGTVEQIEQQLNELSKDGWSPWAMINLSIPNQLAVILEKKAS